MSLLQDILTIAKVSPEQTVGPPLEVARTIAQACNKLPDRQWEQLPDPAQDWANEVINKLATTVEGETPDVMLPDEWIAAGRYTGPDTKYTNGGNGHSQPEQQASRPVIREKTTVKSPIETLPVKTRQRTAKPGGGDGEPKLTRSEAMKKAWETRRANEAKTAKGKVKVAAKPTPATSRRKVSVTRARVGTSNVKETGLRAEGIAEIQFLVKVARLSDCPPSIKASIKKLITAQLNEFTEGL